MGKSYENPAVFRSGYTVQATYPLDARYVVDYKEDLTNGTIDFPYVGLVVNVKHTSSLWLLIDNDVTNINSWKEFKDFEYYDNRFNNIEKDVGDNLQSIIKDLQDKIDDQQKEIDELKDWINSNKKPQLHVTEGNDSESINFIYDKTITKSDNIEFDKDSHSLQFSSGDENANYTRKKLSINLKNNTMKIEEVSEDDDENIFEE